MSVVTVGSLEALVMPDSPSTSPATALVDEGLDDAPVSAAEHRALRRQLCDAQQGRSQAEQINALREEHLAALAHELRAQLASMLLHAQLLREADAEDRPDFRRIGKSLERAAQQQTQLVERLLHDAHELAVDRSASDSETLEPHGLEVPVPSQAAASAGGERSLERPGKSKSYQGLKDARILYIDDDFATREAVFEVLELAGARVAVAGSAAEGMTALETFKPHVIVCDLVMPDEDGYAFLRKLRASEARHASAIPVLAFTGRASSHDKRAALAAGFQLYLSKPIDIDRLRDSVAELVALIRSTDNSDNPDN